MKTVIALALAGVGSLFAVSLASAQTLPPGPNRSVVYGHCRTCHSLQYLIDSAGIDRADWGSILKTMHQLGMPALSDSDRTKILDYLSTYLGPKPPPKTAQAAAGPSHEAVNGKSVFHEQCEVCHQANGRGVAGTFPPLAGNRDLFLSRTFPALVVLNGLQGKVTIEGNAFNGTMPSFSYLSDAQLAAVIGYVRSAWGNDKLRPSGMAKIDAAAVKAARDKKLTAAQVHAYRQKLK